jgi:hypothetical protein
MVLADPYHGSSSVFDLCDLLHGSLYVWLAQMRPKNPIQCPVCKGRGELIGPHVRHKTIDNTIMAKLLRDVGYSYRDIRNFLGYKSPRSVALCLKRKVSQ